MISINSTKKANQLYMPIKTSDGRKQVKVIFAYNFLINAINNQKNPHIVADF
jgi:hypothetical protein